MMDFDKEVKNYKFVKCDKATERMKSFFPNVKHVFVTYRFWDNSIDDPTTDCGIYFDGSTVYIVTQENKVLCLSAGEWGEISECDTSKFVED